MSAEDDWPAELNIRPILKSIEAMASELVAELLDTPKWDVRELE